MPPAPTVLMKVASVVESDGVICAWVADCTVVAAFSEDWQAAMPTAESSRAAARARRRDIIRTPCWDIEHRQPGYSTRVPLLPRNPCFPRIRYAALIELRNVSTLPRKLSDCCESSSAADFTCSAAAPV